MEVHERALSWRAECGAEIMSSYSLVSSLRFRQWCCDGESLLRPMQRINQPIYNYRAIID